MNEPELLLHSLDGKPAPAGLGEALGRLEAVRAKVGDGFAELVLGCLEPMPDDQLEARIARLCRRADLAADLAGPAIQATVFLIREAAAFDVAPADFRADLAALTGMSAVADVLAPLYEKTLPLLRRSIALATLEAHGKVLAGVEWRIDTLGSSNRGRRLNMPIAQLTFHYRDGGKSERVTLQVVPEMLSALRDVTNELLNR